ncbi:MAG TPA: hypothetical protein VHO69_19885, partial [Phototrophicaceae bacterium]|nr:hypothetical protein [Phototrophicaceae bacterium]
TPVTTSIIVTDSVSTRKAQAACSPPTLIHSASLMTSPSGVLGLLGILADEQREAGATLAAEAEEEIEAPAEEPQNEEILVPELEKEHV